MTNTRLLAGLAFVLAIAAAVALILYEGRDRTTPGRPLATVVVSTEDIPNGALLDPLIERGVFVELQIPRYALIDDAVTDLRQLHGLVTVAVIVKNEQISPYRLSRPGIED